MQGSQNRGDRAAMVLGSRARACLGAPVALGPSQTEAWAEESQGRQQSWESTGMPEMELNLTAPGINERLGSAVA